MNNYPRILPLCFTMMFGFGITAGTAQAQSKAAEKAAHVYGTTPMLKSATHPEKTRHHHRKHKVSSSKLKGQEYKSAAAAKAQCPTETVVWVNTHGHIFHLPQSKYYGKTKYGAFACEKAAEIAGFKASTH